MSGPAEAAAAALLPPYARAVGIEIEELGDSEAVLAFDFAERVHGRPGYLHGGALGGLLEMASIVALRRELKQGGEGTQMKPINIKLEYLRGGTDQRTFAAATVTRAGRRIANVSATAWQADRSKPIATAWMNFLLSAPRD